MQEAVLFEPSVAVTTTVLFPILLEVNEEVLRVILGLPQLSLEEATTLEAEILAVPVESKSTVSALQVTTGAMVSPTHTVTGADVLEHPLASVTVTV